MCPVDSSVLLTDCWWASVEVWELKGDNGLTKVKKKDGSCVCVQSPVWARETETHYEIPQRNEH